MRIFVPYEHLSESERCKLESIREEFDKTDDLDKIHLLGKEVDQLIAIALGRFKESNLDTHPIARKGMVTAVHYCPGVRAGGKEWSTLLGRDEHCPVCGLLELDEHGNLVKTSKLD